MPVVPSSGTVFFFEMKLTIYTKQGCSLCDEALEIIERARSRFSFELEEVDVSADDDLAALYGELVPVVEIDGTKIFEYAVNERVLLEMLEAFQAKQTPNGIVGAAR